MMHERWGVGVVICLERGADLHMPQLMPLPLTVSCFSKIQIGFTFLVPAHLGRPGKGTLNGCVCVFYINELSAFLLVLVANLMCSIQFRIWTYFNSDYEHSIFCIRVVFIMLKGFYCLRFSHVPSAVKHPPTSQASRTVGKESVPIQLAQCWLPGLAISSAKI